MSRWKTLVAEKFSSHVARSVENTYDFHAALYRAIENQVAADGNEAEVGDNFLDHIADEAVRKASERFGQDGSGASRQIEDCLPGCILPIFTIPFVRNLQEKVHCSQSHTARFSWR